MRSQSHVIVSCEQKRGRVIVTINHVSRRHHVIVTKTREVGNSTDIINIIEILCESEIS